MNLLITGAWTSAQEHLAEMEQMGHKTAFLQQEQDELPVAAEWVEGVIGNSFFTFHPIEEFENLRYIQLTSAGYDRVPMEYIKSHGIAIHNARGVYSIPMAEFAVAGVLQLYKQMAFFAENQRKHIWEKHRGLLELNGKTVCIVGCGDVGSECAKRFGAFGCRVIGVNRTVRTDPCYETIHGLNELDEVLPAADIIILSLPKVPETYHLIDDRRLQLLKKTAVLVNIGRGAVLDASALEKRIDHLGGAVLDVFEEEPLPEHNLLWKLDNVILTPHNSFVGDLNHERMDRLILRNLMEESQAKN